MSSFVRHSTGLIAVASLVLGALACTEAVPLQLEVEEAALGYASGAGAAGSAGFSSRRSAPLYAEAPDAPEQLVAHVRVPAGPGILTTPQHTQQIKVSWSCDNGKGGKNSGSCDVTGIISAKACVNTIKANCPTKSATVSW